MSIPLPTKRQVQRSVLDMIRKCYPRVWYTAIPNGAHLAGDRVSRFKQMGALKGDGLKVGCPDLLCLWSPGQGAFIECKRPKLGKLSAEQKAVHERLEEIRWPVAVVTSVQEAYDYLFEQGAPRQCELS